MGRGDPLGDQTLLPLGPLAPLAVSPEPTLWQPQAGTNPTVEKRDTP